MNKLRCKQCGYKWVARVALPKKCPDCFSVKWNKKKGQLCRSQQKEQLLLLQFYFIWRWQSIRFVRTGQIKERRIMMGPNLESLQAYATENNEYPDYDWEEEEECDE